MPASLTDPIIDWLLTDVAVGVRPLEKTNPFAVTYFPSHNVVRVKTAAPGTMVIELVDAQGRMLKILNDSGDSQVQFELPELTTGVYFIRVQQHFSGIGKDSGTVESK
ncbi:MAG: T9SS type A sorting domain-containing protein [Bacteroidota bacterium]|nr:T9SS type A sorting domain-containing protein [Bacteroidota bacterium]